MKARRGNRPPQSDFRTQALFSAQREPGAPGKHLEAGVLTNSGLGLPTLYCTNAVKTDEFEV